MKFFQSIIYGFVSGITEFLPISSEAHQYIFGSLLGISTSDPVRRLFVHFAIFMALYIATAKSRARVVSAFQKSMRAGGNRRIRSKSFVEYQLLRRSTIYFLAAFFLLRYILPLKANLFIISMLLLTNGIVVFLPERMLRGNKDAHVMTNFDSAFIGLIGALSVLPGLSRIGCMLSAAALRGVDRKASVHWAILLSIPAIFVWIVLDILAIFSSTNLMFWSNVLVNIVTAVFAFIGTRAGIYILRKHIASSGHTSYAYYCWGVALLALILFLTIA